MQVNQSLYLLLPALALLTACSSSGGSDTGNSTTPMPQPPVVTKPELKGSLIKLSAAGTGMDLSPTTATPALNKVVIEGKTVDFIPEGYTGGDTIGNVRNISNGKVGGALAYTRYGYIKEGNTAPYLFAQGEVTSDMPTTGRAVYTGRAAHIENSTVRLANARFTVDYARHTVEGAITPSGLHPVNLAGTINGNRFEGTHATSGFYTEGRFYGSAAAEMGGIYTNAHGTVNGAYGAKKP